jgi:hypothetical protein
LLSEYSAADCFGAIGFAVILDDLKVRKSAQHIGRGALLAHVDIFKASQDILHIAHKRHLVKRGAHISPHISAMIAAIAVSAA